MAHPTLSPGARLLAVTLKDSDGNVFGQIKEWMMDVDEGRVVYVLATLEKTEEVYVAIPWEALKADKEKGGYLVKTTREQLLNGPHLSTEKITDLATDTNFLDQLYKQYAVAPYWQGNESPSQSSSTGSAPSNANSSKREEIAEGDGHSQPNDLKEKRDESEGYTNTESTLSSGYESSEDQASF